VNNTWVFLGGAFLIGLAIAATLLGIHYLVTRDGDEEDYDEEWW